MSTTTKPVMFEGKLQIDNYDESGNSIYWLTIGDQTVASAVTKHTVAVTIIENISVNPEFWGKGIAHTMISLILEQNEYEAIVLNVCEFNLVIGLGMEAAQSWLSMQGFLPMCPTEKGQLMYYPTKRL